MLSPKRTKYRKMQKGRMRGKALRGGTLHFGDYGLQATECGRINSRQIEAARIAMTRYTKRGGEIWIRVFPDKSITKKPAETRQGKGKGNVEEWAAVIKPGRIIYEMKGIPVELAMEALRLAGHKLPIKCRAISRELEKLHKMEEAKRKAEAKARKEARLAKEARAGA